MAYLNIVSWNVRNLSQTISRQGVRGNGLCIEYRMNNVLKNLTNMGVDIAFLLETGSDGDQVANFIKSRSTFGAIASATTEGESYVMIFKPELFSGFKDGAMIGNNTDNFRKGWLVKFGVGDAMIHFAVLHAPSPSYTQQQRLAQIKRTAQEAINESNNIPLLFMGDLNMKSDQQDALAHEMGTLHMVHLGPFDNDSGGGGQTPALTSLRKYKTILKNQHSMNDEESNSQPYDQFWGNAKVTSLATGNVGTMLVNGPATGHFLSWLTKNLESILTSAQAGVRASRHSRTYNKLDDLYTAYCTLLTNGFLLNEYNSGYLKEIITFPVASWLKTIEKIKLALDTNMNLGAWHEANPSATINLGGTYYTRAKNVLNQTNSAIALLLAACKMVTSGVTGYDEWEKTVFEFTVSDHLPIGIRISYPDQALKIITSKNSRQQLQSVSMENDEQKQN